MDTRIPLLSALRAFDFAARLGSFTGAAAKLGISQSAVTRHIAYLEGNVGIRLFRRGRRGVELTAEGRSYHEEILQAFDIIGAATKRLRERSAEDVLHLRVYPVFAAKWLIPRLPSFKAWAPSITVQLDTTVAPTDFERSALDAAIEFGDEQPARHMAQLLMRDEIEPVCSPRFLEKYHGALTLNDLRQLPLLHAHYRKSDWPDWAAANGLLELQGQPSTIWPSSLLAYQAAEAGMGLAMGQTLLLERELEQGLLVRPFDKPLRRAQAYYLRTPLFRSPPRRVRMFMGWLKQMLPQAQDQPQPHAAEA